MRLDELVRVFFALHIADDLTEVVLVLGLVLSLEELVVFKERQVVADIGNGNQLHKCRLVHGDVHQLTVGPEPTVVAVGTRYVRSDVGPRAIAVRVDRAPADHEHD